LQIGTNTRTHGKLDGDNTNRNKKETLRPWFLNLMKTKAYCNLQLRWRIEIKAQGDDNDEKCEAKNFVETMMQLKS
jgi:hypothetical protein